MAQWWGWPVGGRVPSASPTPHLGRWGSVGGTAARSGIYLVLVYMDGCQTKVLSWTVCGSWGLCPKILWLLFRGTIGSLSDSHMTGVYSSSIQVSVYP